MRRRTSSGNCSLQASLVSDQSSENPYDTRTKIAVIGNARRRAGCGGVVRTAAAVGGITCDAHDDVRSRVQDRD